MYVCIRISYNMGKRDLPDIYALARGFPIAHVISNIYITKINTTSNKSSDKF